MRLLYFSISLIFLFGGFALAQKTENSKIENIDRILGKLFADETFNGNVLIGENGRIIYEKSFGWSNYENKIPLTQATIFPIGSVSKSFTAVAVLKLKEQGKLRLDDSIVKYFPDLPYKNITLRQMLSHTSGLPEYQSKAVIDEIEEKSVNNAELEKVFERLNLKEDFAPGSRWEYSNTNFIFLALVVEKVSNVSYAQFLRENIFRPAKMTDTFVLRSGVPEPLKKRIADGYRSTSFVAASESNINALRGANSYYATVSNLYGAGGIYSTVRDLFKFHEALQKNKILKKQTLTKMYAAADLNNREDYAALKNTNYESKYGSGWFIAKDETGGKIVYHPGGVVGYVGYFLRNLAKNQTVIVLANNENLKHYTPTALLRILDNQPYKLDKKSLAAALGREYNRNGFEAAKNKFDELKNNPDYNFRAGEMDALGYQLFLEKKDASAAITILKMNAEKFPESFEVWDSLGEIYYKSGNREEAIKNYEKSLQINPDNKNGKQMLEKIRQDTTKP